MPNTLLFQTVCKNERGTAALAASLAAVLQPGALVALTGDLGAGKSTFARAFIRARLANLEAEVPSPTFTLVQTYDDPNGIEIWHADLYRLSEAEEVYELGLDDARDDAICLIEWPDRMPAYWWDDALEIKLDIGGEGVRKLAFHGEAARWRGLLEGFGT
ncbi:tRNA (adenosine(37)-N6)-threonylcarbamoyltransferase complex ATPase subunit type 1 TsaE [Kordiimonas aestuarii]|uniref:tRNA (adenosine(37)-N6)-threonylcarbamoyltransferase complex ATPase subunit type 1 TsaE n=1 Tax=Kordiimonas aestuarii TaxID=1005925 RepID=UPI0021D399E4|nr:tRNA (adenosine(37)-N6)-threonylcarbamoyltransferase complex ATPase subunit type 1 TsaE [Kordiimonas aestuarii]